MNKTNIRSEKELKLRIRKLITGGDDFINNGDEITEESFGRFLNSLECVLDDGFTVEAD